MDLDLERFWKVVRPKRRAPLPARKPKSLRLHVEAVESARGARCTNLVEVLLTEVLDGYSGEVDFGVMNSEVNITGFRWYARPGGPSSFMRCEPHHLGPGDHLVLGLFIMNEGKVMVRLRKMGLVY